MHWNGLSDNQIEIYIFDSEKKKDKQQYCKKNLIK